MIIISRIAPCPFAEQELIQSITESLMIKEKKYDPEKTDVSIILTDDPQLKKLNSLWRKKNKTTDILSFNINEQEGDRFLLGELYLSVSQIRKQARMLGHSPKRELAILLIHGLLHLHGYEHEHSASKDEIKKMASRENRYRKLWANFR